MDAAVALVEPLAALLIARGERVAFAESCTGGLIAKLATDLAGSSAWFERGLVTYTNQAKQELLDVPPEVFDTVGAVSRDCALAMVAGLMQHSPADWGAAVTGIAGPAGGSPDKPVGTVWLAWMRRGHPPQAHRELFSGDRIAIREQTAERALAGLVDRIRNAG